MSKQPNILLITTDQQRYDTIAAMGYDYMYTPNLDRLGAGGAAAFECLLAESGLWAARRRNIITGLRHAIMVLMITILMIIQR